MNLTRLKVRFLRISVLLIFAVSAQSQDATERWISLASPKGDVTLAMPTNPSVHRASDLIRAFCNENGATLDFEVLPKSDPKISLKFSGQEFNYSGTVEIRDFQLGKISGRTRIMDGIYYSISIYIAGKNFYRITASAESSRNPILKEFLSSIRIDGQALMQQASAQPTDPIRINSLDTTADVKRALKAADADSIFVSQNSAARLEALNSDGPYSRIPLIFRRPRAIYTDAARLGNVQGDVVLFVKLRSDGSIGNMIVRKGLPDGLTEKAVSAAKRIKFLPAQKNGRDVDFYVPLRYSFAIY